MFYSLSPQVQEVARKNGIQMDVVCDMVGKSARHSHPDGNRRYHDWLFKVEGPIVSSMTKVSKVSP